MLGLLCILSLLIGWMGCFWLVREWAEERNIHLDWRLNWMFACLGCGSILTLIAEIGSLAHSLNRPTLVLLWVAADIAILCCALRLRKSRRTVAVAACETVESGVSFRRWPIDAKALAAATAVIVLFLFFVALLTPTTNIDSLAYHLARMAHWIQQSGVQHYPTDDLRQLEFGPWSSFVMTNLFLLWGNDQLLNLAQWFAMVSSVIVLSWVAEQSWRLWRMDTSSAAAKEEARTVAFTCFLAVTLPIGIVESISTQNDYSTAFWVLSIFACALLLMKEPSNPIYAAGAGLASGLGTLTKATTYMYAGPLIVAGGLWWLKRLYSRQSVKAPGSVLWDGLRNRLVCLRLPCLFAGAFFLLNAPHMARNYALFNSPLGSPEMLSLERNERFSHRVVASNLIRNAALHTNSGIPWLTRGLNAVLARLHEFTGEELNDPATTLPYCRFEFRQKFRVSDSVASCTGHLLLCAIAFVFAFRHPMRNRGLILYLAPVLASVLFFLFFLKWQLWHSRIHLAWFLLLTPLTAIALCNWRIPWAAWGAAAALLVSAALTITVNSSRPVFSGSFWKLPREKQYFASTFDNERADALMQLADRIVASKSQNVGLKAGLSGIEYPLWMMLRTRGFHGRVDRCFVANVSAQIPTIAQQPDVVISVYNIIPEVVSNSYPHSEKAADLTVLWKNKPDWQIVNSAH